MKSLRKSIAISTAVLMMATMGATVFATGSDVTSTPPTKQQTMKSHSKQGEHPVGDRADFDGERPEFDGEKPDRADLDGEKLDRADFDGERPEFDGEKSAKVGQERQGGQGIQGGQRR